MNLRRKSCKRHYLRALLAVLLAAGLLRMAEPVHAQESPPAVRGKWTIENDHDQRKVIIVQKGNEISGTAVRPGGGLAFKFSGSIDTSGKMTLKVFYDRSDAPGASPEAFAAAVKLAGDKDHPDLLPAKSEMDLQYDKGSDQLIGHILKLKITIHHDPNDGDDHTKDTLTQDKEIPAEATLTRSYAWRCAATMGEIPAFSCAKGSPLPITAKGTAQSFPVEKCDRPIQLPLSVDKGKPSQCVPGATLVKIPIGDHPNVETLAICRKYNKSFAEGPTVFNDIAMVSYDTKTGQTCFYQSKTGDPFDTAALDASGMVPSPTADNASDLWQDKMADTTTRGGTGPAGVRCNACHSAGPFVWTPYLGQATNIDIQRWGQVTADAPYDANFANMFSQPAYTFRFKNNDCTDCHRIGSGSNCGFFVPSFTTSPNPKNRLDITHAWMPLALDYDRGDGGIKEADQLIADLSDTYRHAIAQIADCCTNPDKAVCSKTIQGTP